MRNFSINRYFARLGETWKPAHRFAGATKADWQSWRGTLYPAVKASRGAAPPPVPLNAEVQAVWEQDGLVKERIVFDVEEGLSVAAYLFRPTGASGRLPAILACHGHGPYGKDSVMGIATTPAEKAKIDEHNYDYGLQMAKAGYAVIAIDWRGFGERDDRKKPNNNDVFWGRDPCDTHYDRATLLGRTVLGMNVHDGKRALDYLLTRDFVDPNRIGAMGLSFGGTMTLWMTLMDERIKAADIICYSDRFAEFALTHANFCGSQVSPGLFALGDVCDLQGLIAPRPLLVEMGTYDTCFYINSARKCFTEVEKIYRAAGCADRLELDLFEGGHAWGANRTKAFFAKHLP